MKFWNSCRYLTVKRGTELGEQNIFFKLNVLGGKIKITKIKRLYKKGKDKTKEDT